MEIQIEAYDNAYLITEKKPYSVLTLRRGSDNSVEVILSGEKKNYAFIRVLPEELRKAAELMS